MERGAGQVAASPRRSGRATALVAMVLVACPHDEDGADTDGPPDDTGTTADDVEGSGSGSDGGGPCGAGICVQSPPEGWFGPIVRFDNDGTQTAPACGGGWPDAAFTLLGGYVDPGPAQCGACTCGVDVAALCSVAGYRTEGSETCEFDDAFQLADVDTCYEHALAEGSLWLWAFTDNAPICHADFTSEIPEATWMLEVTGCRGAEPDEACDDAGRQCVPEVPEGFTNNVCIFANGDLDCPSGDYTEKTVLYSSVEDTRTCGQCMCGEPPAGGCTGDFEIFASEDCSGDAAQSLPENGGCTGALSSVGSLRFDYDGPSECEVSLAPGPAGSIAPVGEITYCCVASGAK